ncbi:MAG: aspartate 1-decarboxylase [Bacteriovoracaceae bacterium]|nr:aspartate 1-decarboxylase [Bacteriovoracaceae bacterium]
MQITVLKSKLHRATVTEADLEYEGSISICPKLCEAAHFHLHEKVEIFNITNGNRFSTYVIHGKEGQICLNGAAARLVHRGDQIIVVTYGQIDQKDAHTHKPLVVLLKENNEIKSMN